MINDMNNEDNEYINNDTVCKIVFLSIELVGWTKTFKIAIILVTRFIIRTIYLNLIIV